MKLKDEGAPAIFSQGLRCSVPSNDPNCGDPRPILAQFQVSHRDYSDLKRTFISLRTVRKGFRVNRPSSLPHTAHSNGAYNGSIGGGDEGKVLLARCAIELMDHYHVGDSRDDTGCLRILHEHTKYNETTNTMVRTQPCPLNSRLSRRDNC